MKRVHHVTLDAPPHQVGEEGESILQKREALVLGSESNVVHFTGIKGVGMTPLRPAERDFEGRGRSVHFTGIKGVGMTALALAYQDRGWEVWGSDTSEPQITDEILKSREIHVFERFTPRNVSKIEKSRWVPTIDRLIYTGAHHGVHNVEVKWAISRNIPVANYANALGEFFADKKQICVCGVGGKTTTTAMLSTILHRVNLDPSWVIGTSEVSSLPAPGRYGKGEWAVLESDEYVADPAIDRTPKFMYLQPRIIICTNIEYDHPDVFANKQETVVAYQRFFEKLPDDGMLFISSQTSSVIPDLIRNLSRITSGTSYRSRVKPFDSELRTSELPGMTIYDEDQELQKSIERVIDVPGEYNVTNAMAAVSVATRLGIPQEKALEALSTYRGSKRRFEHIGSVSGIDLYDDYAHHPHEISALSIAAKATFPGRRIRFIFQPHTYSRTKALFDEFVESLLPVDEVVMFPIFSSAREEIDPSVSSQMLAEAVVKRGGRARFISTRTKLVEYLCLSVQPGDVIMTVGAGNLYDIHDDLVSCLRQTRKASSKK